MWNTCITTSTVVPRARAAARARTRARARARDPHFRGSKSGPLQMGVQKWVKPPLFYPNHRIRPFKVVQKVVKKGQMTTFGGPLFGRNPAIWTPRRIQKVVQKVVKKGSNDHFWETLVLSKSYYIPFESGPGSGQKGVFRPHPRPLLLDPLFGTSPMHRY